MDYLVFGKKLMLLGKFTLLRMVSVTRFGEISPFWQNMLRHWQNFNGLFSIWQKFDAIGQIYIVANGQILKVI